MELLRENFDLKLEAIKGNVMRRLDLIEGQILEAREDAVEDNVNLENWVDENLDQILEHLGLERSILTGDIVKKTED